MYREGTSELRQGSVIEEVPFPILDQREFGVLLTPECDLVQGKADTVLLVAAFRFNELAGEMAFRDPRFQGAEGQLSRAPSRAALDSLKDKLAAIQRNTVPRYHWLDQIPDGPGPFVVDFQYLSCLVRAEADDFVVIANLDDPYRSALPARYASYAGRIGVPDPDGTTLDNIRSALLGTMFETGR